MTRIVPPQHILVNLKKQLGKKHYWYMNYTEAYREAISYSGIDFGDDIDKWEDWFSNYPELVGSIYSTGSLKAQCLLLIKNLRDQISPTNRDEYVEPEHAVALLIEKTGQDFGKNTKAWEHWIGINLSENTDI